MDATTGFQACYTHDRPFISRNYASVWSFEERPEGRRAHCMSFSQKSQAAHVWYVLKPGLTQRVSRGDAKLSLC